MKALATLFIAIAALSLSVFSLSHQSYFETTNPVTLGSFSPSGGGTYYLNSSIGTGDATIHLSSFKEPISNIPYTMSYLNTDRAYFTLDPQTSRSEFGSFTGITQNANGTADLTGVVRGLSRTPGTGGCVASSTLAQSHPGRGIMILSNSPCFYEEYAKLRTTSTIQAPWTFNAWAVPRMSASTTDADIVAAGTSSLVTYQLLTEFVGTSNGDTVLKGVFEQGTAAEASSSATTGGTGANLVVGTNLVSATPGASLVAMAQSTGKLLQGWFDLAASWVFTGGLSSTGTTTISASNVSTNPLKLNGVAFSFPTTQGASSTALMNDGSGNLTWNTTGQCSFSWEGGTLSNTPGYTYVNYPHNLGSSNYTIRAHWEGNGNDGTAFTTWGEGYATSSTATSSAFALSLPSTAAGIPNGLSGSGLAAGRYLIHLQGSATDKLYAWVNYVSATNTQLQWAIQSASTVNYRLVIEQCR